MTKALWLLLLGSCSLWALVIGAAWLVSP